jgi:membrane-bound lytic murein transglycosylase D
MAAYDWGLGRVQHLVAKTGYADYWELYRRGGLPAETKAYIPSVIAAVIMAKNPEQYGLSDLQYDPPVLSDTITTHYAIDLRLVADVTGATVPEIVALNPALLRLSTPQDIPYDLHVPPGSHDLYLSRVKQIPEANRASWRFHVVKAGETLDEIAASLHGHATEIASLNDVTPGTPIEAGDELVVPVAVASVSAGEQRYTPRAKDTLVTVADRFGVSVEQLRAWNHLGAGHLVPGKPIYVSEPMHLAPGMRATRGRHSAATGTKGASAAAKGKRSGVAHTAAHPAARGQRAAPAKAKSSSAVPAKKKSSH